ncbi:MAG TPA: hypothetical protein VHW03_06815 [Chthoniobacterales bacterium]|nr:hypothetical protein [Chthoniobacterales bacterium]
MDTMGHLTNDERTAYWQRTLPPATLLELSDHLQTCESCRDELRRGQPSTANEEAITYEDLVAWIDGDLDPLSRRELAARISTSSAASAELLDLLQFRETMNALPARDYGAREVVRPSSNRWIALAAGVLLGGVMLWWTTAMHDRAGAIAITDSGKQLIVRPDGAIPALGVLPADLRQSVHEAAVFGRVDQSGLTNDLRGARETLAGAPSVQSSFRVLAPVGSVVEAERPLFRWNPRPGATGYRVNYLNQKSGAVVSSPLLAASATSWSPNDSLKPNDTYEWEVEALRDGAPLAKAPAPPEPEARFRVLAPAPRAELAALQKKWSDSHLIMGIEYARLGLVDEAKNELAALVRENPGDPFPKKLLASLTQ